MSPLINGVIDGPREPSPVCLLVFVLPPNFASAGANTVWFPNVIKPPVCITIAMSCSLLFYGVCLYQSALFTFSFVENPEIHSETPAAPALPPTAPPKPKPKPKPKKSPVPPKGATAGASHKGDEVPPNRKNVKAPSKQAPTPPPKPTSRNTTREAGEYALVHNWVEFRMLGSGMGL